MHFDGVSGIDELAGKTVKVFLFPLRKNLVSLPAEVVLKDGGVFIDVLPLKKGKHVWSVPDDSLFTEAKDQSANPKYALFIRESSETGLLLADAFENGLGK